MDERYFHEAAVPLIALARIWQQIGAAGSAALSNGAVLLLEQMLSLCSAQRGALLLPRGPSIAHVGASLLAPTLVEGVRILAKVGMSEEDLLPLLMAFGSAGADGWTRPDAPGWLLYRIHLTGASARHADEPAGSSPAEPFSPARFPLDALLVLGWNVID